jgi:catechol 2,3-dioxygenase-like lactoylglutathione lyase family enzyme
MGRIDHVAVETERPAETAAFYENALGARVVAEEGHPVMAYLGATAFAFHKPEGSGPHTAVRVSEDERAQIAARLDRAGVEHWQRDHRIAVGLFFRDPDGRLIEAITYRSGDDPRRPSNTGI